MVFVWEKKKTNARIPLTFSFESEKLDYNQRCITHNKWFFVISGYFWYGVLEGKRVSYILVTVFFPKFHLKFTLTNSVKNINKLDSNAHLGLFSNGWIRFKVSQNISVSKNESIGDVLLFVCIADFDINSWCKSNNSYTCFNTFL